MDDIKRKLNTQYDNIAIYTSGFYADPEDELGTHDKLMDTLKSLTMNQHADTPFSLQIMTTNGEINVMPLGLLNLDELKEYETSRRQKDGLNSDSDGIPLLIQFAAHTDKAKVEREVIGTTQDLFADFNGQFVKIWDVIKGYLRTNQNILVGIERDLITDSKDVQEEYYNKFQTMKPEEREKNLGFPLKDAELEHFSVYMADMHEVQAIVLSAGSFSQNEILGENMFNQVMNDSVLRSTLFWVLDNTFYEILYYFIEKYKTAPEMGDKIEKRLHHLKKMMIINMRNDAFERAQKQMENPKTKFDINNYYTDIFIPIAEQLSAEIDKFKN
ncbi:hypothetical protein AYR62_00715 [Secundilactobacillus paracollinoides]|uniref:Uncharacterized protein n=1 Tax=Secundilactobacillus paracollinoides TaxID=240427 RepID=A0A1B2IVN2_9LACO|nr:hypothetical protein [Secundilactobacillus paracollinoides]ANZ62763.1 hypothetical protein AYR62_00715 [Secundilactobacillus paracollinoides]ANZ66079.1 hypothetical protein AYR63_02230 [Secundilactobacillus paracollinoides]